MKRLTLLLTLAVSLAACAPSTVAPVTAPDALGASLSATTGTSYTTLRYTPGSAASFKTVLTLKGPALRLNDARCTVSGGSVTCQFGTVQPAEARVVYVTGLSGAVVDATRKDGSAVHAALK